MSEIRPEGPPALSFHDLDLGYGKLPAIRGLSGTVARGALLALVGANGAGKSTLLRAVAGEIAAQAGTIDRHGLGGRDIAYLPQAAVLDRSFPISVAELAGMGLLPRYGLLRRVTRSDRDTVRQALDRVGLGGFGQRPIGSLSGGQLQRTLFARTLLQDARLVLLDEPFASIDADTTADLLRLLRAWHGEGRTVIAALHDLSHVRDTFPETLLLAGGPVSWGRTADVLTPDSLERARSTASAREMAWWSEGRPALRAASGSS